MKIEDRIREYLQERKDETPSGKTVKHPLGDEFPKINLLGNRKMYKDAGSCSHKEQEEQYHQLWSSEDHKKAAEEYDKLRDKNPGQRLRYNYEKTMHMRLCRKKSGSDKVTCSSGKRKRIGYIKPDPGSYD